MDVVLTTKTGDRGMIIASKSSPRRMRNHEGGSACAPVNIKRSAVPGSQSTASTVSVHLASLAFTVSACVGRRHPVAGRVTGRWRQLTVALVRVAML